LVKRNFTAEQWSHVQSLEHDVIQLPPAWHQPASPVSPDLFAGRDRLTSATLDLRNRYDDLLWGDYSAEQDLMLSLRRGDPVPSDKQTSFALFLTDVQRLIDQTSQTVALPGYTMELGIFSAGTSGLLSVQTFAKYTSIVALYMAQHGNCYGAMDTVLLPLRYTNRTERSTAITHLIAVAVTSITSYSTYALATQCSDTMVLEYGLDQMNRFRHMAFPGDVGNWKYGDSIGALTYAANAGYPADLTPQPMVGYYCQSVKLYDGTYHRWIIQNLPESDPRVAVAKVHLAVNEKYPQYHAKMEDEIETESMGSNDLGWSEISALKLMMGVNIYALMYNKAMPNYREMETRTSVSLAWYDLTRIHFASRLAALNSSATMPAARDSAATTLTAYLSPLPDDPFTLSSFLFSEKLGKHYSVGPDKADDKAAVIYDATNGTVSTGDLWVAPE
jgi:hypothetical protein